MDNNLDSITETNLDGKILLGVPFKKGTYLKFQGHEVTIYACACEITEDNVVNYIRDSLTRWSVGKSLIEKTGEYISEDTFLSKVIDCARQSESQVPTKEGIKAAIEVFKGNFDCDFSEILSSLQ